MSGTSEDDKTRVRANSNALAPPSSSSHHPSSLTPMLGSARSRSRSPSPARSRTARKEKDMVSHRQKSLNQLESFDDEKRTPITNKIDAAKVLQRFYRKRCVCVFLFRFCALLFFFFPPVQKVYCFCPKNYHFQSNETPRSE